MTNESDNPLEGGALVSTLARLDQEWKLQQRASPGKSRWTKFILPQEEKNAGNDEDDVIELDPTVETAQDFVYLLEPPSSMPSTILVFLGGAGLGQFPQIAYSEFLTRLSDKLNAAVLTVPYQVGLDHFAISKSTGELIRRALKHCQDDPSRQYPATLPRYALAHSLGAKLQTIYTAAMQPHFDGLGFISYNNFGFSQTIGMAKSMAEQLQFGQPQVKRGSSDEILNTIFSFAEQAIGAIGLDFLPSKEDMNRLISMRYNAEDQSKTRLFVFDNDDLDSSQSFVESCQGGGGPSVSGLPGNHLTPVYFKLGLDDLPEEGRAMASEAIGGMESFSFGNEKDLDSLVEEVCGWISGKSPTRGPNWSYDDQTARLDPPRIEGMST